MDLQDKSPQRFTRRRLVIALIAALALGAGAYYTLTPKSETAEAGPGGPGGPSGPGGRRGMGNRPQPVKASEVRIGNLDVVLAALGTITASNTAIVKPRVDGQLIKINFREGQTVKAGDLLAEIDPRPFQIQLDQASGQLAKDEALLAAAKVDLERYRALLAKDSIAKQQVDTQEALVRQYKGVVETDKAQVDNARLQLGFTRVTAPAGGRLGLRQVDVGNNVRSTDTNGIVVITQTQPIYAVFAIPAESIGDIVARIAKGESIEVEAWDRDGRTRLTSGKLLSVDNQIDVATGTVKLKAEFANRDNSLFPNQFVNIRVKAETRSEARLVAASAIQRNAEGSFVYVINPDEQTVKPRKLRLGPGNGEFFVVEEGLERGEQVVADGADRLRPGSKVDVLSLDGKSVGNRRPEGSESRPPNPEGGPRPEKAPAAAEATRGERPVPPAAPPGESPRTPGKPGEGNAAAPSSPANSSANSTTNPAANPAANPGNPGSASGAEGERRGRRCAPEAVAADPELAARCERWRQRREAEGGGSGNGNAPREGGRRGE